MEEAIPPVGLTFTMFRLMVILGSYFLLFIIVALVLAYRRPATITKTKWLQWISMLSVPLMWLCSQAGWAVAEVGRQPWTVQDLLPTKAAISAVSSSSVIITFWMFAAIFTALLIAEVSIMVRTTMRESKKNLELDNH